METIRILIFNWRWWLNPGMGGAEVFTYKNAKRQVRARHEVTLLTSEFPNCEREGVVDGVRIVRLVGSIRFTGRLRSIIENYFSKESNPA